MSFYKDAKPGKHGYVSEFDEFLLTYNQNRNQISNSTKLEIEKHKTIAAKRDKILPEKQTNLWEDF